MPSLLPLRNFEKCWSSLETVSHTHTRPLTSLTSSLCDSESLLLLRPPSSRKSLFFPFYWLLPCNNVELKQHGHVNVPDNVKPASQLRCNHIKLVCLQALHHSKSAFTRTCLRDTWETLRGQDKKAACHLGSSLPEEPC